MKRVLSVLIATGIAISGVAIAAPAEASKTTPAVTLNASPEPVVAGHYAKLTGRVGASHTHSSGRVNIYFRKSSASTYTYVSYTMSSASGYYTKYRVQSTSGYWKVRFVGNSYRNSAYSRVDYVQARSYRTINRTVWKTTSLGDHSGGSINISRAPMRVYVDLSCSSNVAPFISLTWHGYPSYDWENIWLEPSSTYPGISASTTQYMYPSVSSGYFEVATQSDCWWSVTATQAVTGWITV